MMPLSCVEGTCLITKPAMKRQFQQIYLHMEMLHIYFAITVLAWDLSPINTPWSFIAGTTKWILVFSWSFHVIYCTLLIQYVYNINYKKKIIIIYYINLHIKISCCLHSYQTNEFIWVTISLYNNRGLWSQIFQNIRYYNHGF